jgi:ribosome biogenesis ATPase
LSEQEVSGFAVSRTDFTEALKTVQPSAKREGFATVPNVTWADIGALSTVREELEMAIVEPMKEPETFEAFGINAPSGVLLWGPPGCGKTLLAKAVASESRANFISVKGPELLNKVSTRSHLFAKRLMGSTSEKAKRRFDKSLLEQGLLRPVSFSLMSWMLLCPDETIQWWVLNNLTPSSTILISSPSPLLE